MTTPRFISATGQALVAYTPRDLLTAVRRSEGRTLACEVICPTQPLVDGISNGELAAAFGADLLLLNFYDVQSPAIAGLPDGRGDSPHLLHTSAGIGCTAADMKRLTGRPVAINLEPSNRIPAGRRATPENAELALAQGVNMILLTGNPETGVTNEGIMAALTAIRERLGDRIILGAGRMHAAGTDGTGGRRLVGTEEVTNLVRAGADVILVPAPGTIPGMTVERVAELVAAAQHAGALAMTAIGTSQEGADSETLRRLAIDAKMTGADIHHLGDAGLCGVAVPENILAYSIALKGRRHTYRRMAASVLR